MPTKKAPPKPNLPQYKLSLHLGNELHEAEAPSVAEGLDAIKSPNLHKAKGIITVTYGKLKAQVILFPIHLKKLFNNKTAKVLFQKRILGALK